MTGIAQTCKRKNKKDERIFFLVLVFMFVLKSLHLFMTICLMLMLALVPAMHMITT